jgi:hypothetical protein
MNIVLTLFLIFGCAAALSALMIRVIVWGFGPWRDYLRCEKCGYTGTFPWAYPMIPCRKCGDRNWKSVIAKAKFWGGFIEKQPEPNSRGDS